MFKHEIFTFDSVVFDTLCNMHEAIGCVFTDYSGEGFDFFKVEVYREYDEQAMIEVLEDLGIDWDDLVTEEI